MGKRTLAIIEPALIFGLIMLYIWRLRFTHHEAWLAILALILASHISRHEAADSMGFHCRNLRACLDRFAPALLFFGLVLVAAGLLLQTTRHIRFEDAILAWTAYLPWGLFQQYLLNGYFLNRFNAALPPRGAATLAAVLFSGAHLPNWFLMLVTLGSGYCAAVIYRRYQNLYFLGILHATIGFLLYLVVPDSISHHLTVGPGWFRR
jgi:hypothetical protein